MTRKLAFVTLLAAAAGAIGCSSPPPANPPPATPQIEQATLETAYKDTLATWYLTATNVEPPLSWSLDASPTVLSWLQLEADTGILHGTCPDVLTTTVIVRATDSSTPTPRVAERTYTLSVASCQDGKVLSCLVAAGGACTVGTQTCSGGSFGACTGSLSTAATHCGQVGSSETCSSCGPGGAYGDSCTAGATCSCGGGAACTGAHATTTCTGAVCQNSCNANWGDCDTDRVNGCEQQLNTADHCGTCTGTCYAPTGGTSNCADYTCHKSCTAANTTWNGSVCACNAGWRDCNTNVAVDGCETYVSGSDVNNCGSCGHVCSGTTNGYATCTSGACGIACNGGYEVCNGACALAGTCGGGGGGGGGGCFIAGTPVTMADGSTKAIDRIVAGDRILAMDTETRTLREAVVAHPIFHETTPALFRVNGRLVTTPNHSFFVNGEWRHAIEMRIGDTLVAAAPTGDGFDVAPEIVTQLELLDGGVPVYNLEIEEMHDYFAGGTLVHNALKQ